MPRTYHRIKQRYPCPQCGLVVLNHRNAIHQQSVYHRRSPRVRALLEARRLNFQQIGQVLGVTREYVRQIATRLGVSPIRKRHPDYSLEERRAHALRHSPLLADAIREAERHGLIAELIPRKSNAAAYRLRAVQVGRFTCELRSLFPLFQDLFILRAPRPRPEFVLAKSPYGWMVIPGSRLPEGGSTAFILGRDKKSPGTRRHRHDWPRYLNAWDLLRESKATGQDGPDGGQNRKAAGWRQYPAQDMKSTAHRP